MVFALLPDMATGFWRTFNYLTCRLKKDFRASKFSLVLDEGDLRMHSTMQPTAIANSGDVMLSFLAVDFTTVTVRIEDTKFAVYKAILTAVSPYFQKAFNGSFQESNQQAITLKGISKSSFRIFLHWAFVHSLPFDTQSAALGYSILLLPNEAKKPTAPASEEDATVRAGSDHTVDAAQGAPVFDDEAFIRGVKTKINSSTTRDGCPTPTHFF